MVNGLYGRSGLFVIKMLVGLDFKQEKRNAITQLLGMVDYRALGIRGNAESVPPRLLFQLVSVSVAING